MPFSVPEAQVAIIAEHVRTADSGFHLESLHQSV
jgi:hypothetical protein